MVFTCLSTFVNTKADNCRTLAKLPNRKKAASRTGYPSNSFEAPMPRCERSPSRNPARKPPPPPPRRFCNGLDLGAFQGKSNLGLDAQMALKARPLLSRAVLKGFCGFMKPQASKTKHEELPRCAILGHVDARTHVSELLKLVFRAWRPMR